LVRWSESIPVPRSFKRNARFIQLILRDLRFFRKRQSLGLSAFSSCTWAAREWAIDSWSLSNRRTPAGKKAAHSWLKALWVKSRTGASPENLFKFFSISGPFDALSLAQGIRLLTGCFVAHRSKTKPGTKCLGGPKGRAPKGLEDSAQGFNPGNRPPRAIRPEGAADRTY
jgi:hypothetical protein